MRVIEIEIGLILKLSHCACNTEEKQSEDSSPRSRRTEQRGLCRRHRRRSASVPPAVPWLRSLIWVLAVLASLEVVVDPGQSQCGMFRLLQAFESVCRFLKHLHCSKPNAVSMSL